MCARFYLELCTYVESYRKFKCLILLFKKNNNNKNVITF